MLERNALLVLGNYVYHGCDCSNVVDKDSFTIVCLMKLQRLTYYFTSECGEHIYYSFGVLCMSNIAQGRESSFHWFHFIKFWNNRIARRWYACWGEFRAYCVLWVNQEYSSWVIHETGVSFYSHEEMTPSSKEPDLDLLVHLQCS